MESISRRRSSDDVGVSIFVSEASMAVCTLVLIPVQRVSIFCDLF